MKGDPRRVAEFRAMAVEARRRDLERAHLCELLADAIEFNGDSPSQLPGYALPPWTPKKLWLFGLDEAVAGMRKGGGWRPNRWRPEDGYIELTEAGWFMHVLPGEETMPWSPNVNDLFGYWVEVPR